MSLFESNPSPHQAFQFRSPGVAREEFNPFLSKVLNFDRPMRCFHVAYAQVIYPTPVIRVDWAQPGPFEARAHALQFKQRQAENGDGIADWLIATAWAMGSRWIAHADLPPGAILTGRQEQAYSPMIQAIDRIVRPQVASRYAIPFETKDFYHQAADHGATVWTFDVSGPRWATLSPAKRQEMLAKDPTLRPRSDGFRALPIAPEVLERIKGVEGNLVTFAEAVSFRGTTFIPLAAVHREDEFLL